MNLALALGVFASSSCFRIASRAISRPTATQSSTGAGRGHHFPDWAFQLNDNSPLEFWQ